MLERMLKSFVKTGKLTIIRADGTRFAAGNVASGSDPDIVLRLKKRWTEFKIAINRTFISAKLIWTGRWRSNKAPLPVCSISGHGIWKMRL